MTPRLFRVFAATDDSTSGRAALHLVKALLRIAPVRVLGAGAVPGFFSTWRGFESLMTTPVELPYVNVVACAPERWTWKHKFAMPNKDGTTETAEDRVELWTANVRNVLLAAESPRDDYQIATAKKYDVVLVPRADLATWWAAHGVKPRVIELPIDPGATQQTFRQAVLGE